MPKIAFGTTKLLDGFDTPGVGDAVIVESPARAYQMSIDGAGATAVVVIEGSLDGRAYIQLGSATLSTDENATEGFASVAPWRYIRASVLDVQGGGVVFAYVGV